MAGRGARDSSEITGVDGAALGDRCEGADCLTRFSTLITPDKTILDVGCGDGLPADRYLVKQGLAVNGIDASPVMIERARKNVPDGFYEVKDMFDLREGEYCVNGVLSLRALLHIPRERYSTLLEKFASFMPTGGALLLALRSDDRGRGGDDARSALASRHPAGVCDNTEVLEDAGFTIIVDDVGGGGQEKYHIVLARS
jgi:cyclopropane fatty-acyl-phospholipid synthase-like methyltransferase